MSAHSVLECNIRLSHSSCSGTIKCSKLVDDGRIDLQGYGIFIDGMSPKYENGVYVYDLDISHIVQQKLTGAFIKHGSFVEIMGANGRIKKVNRMFPLLGFCQNYESVNEISYEDRDLESLLEEFNSYIMVGTRIGDYSEPSLEIIYHEINSTKVEGGYVMHTVHVFKGVGYQGKPDRVEIQKVGPFYFTKTEQIREVALNGDLVGKYNRLGSNGKVKYEGETSLRQEEI